MGYTHEFYFKKKQNKFSEEAINKIAKIISSLRETGIVNDRAVVSSNEIMFNGVGDHACEDFILTPHTILYNSTKTNKKKYDFVVCVVLLILKIHHKEDFFIFSDGFQGDTPNAWLNAMKFVNHLYKRQAVNLQVEDGFIIDIIVY